MDCVARRFLANSEMHDRPPLVACHDLTVDLAHEPADGGDPFRWRLTSREHGTVAIAEHAIESVHPHSSRSVTERMRSRRVGRSHSTERAEISAGWINGKTQALSPRGDVESRP